MDVAVAKDRAGAIDAAAAAAAAAAAHVHLPKQQAIGTRADVFFTPLESLRGVAALIVVMYHALWLNPLTTLTFFRNGALMVDFFFVLSGFVIFHSYGSRLNRLADLPTFLWLRLGRLYPLHVAFLLVFLAIECAKYAAQVRFGIVADKPAFTVNGAAAFTANLFLIQALTFNSPLTFNYPAWTISVEFYAYIVFALARIALSRGAWFLAGSALFVCSSAAVLLWGGKWSLADCGNGWAFYRCCGGFFLGVLTYVLYRRVARAESARAAASHRWQWLCPVSITLTVLLMCEPLAGAWSFCLPLLAAATILSTVCFPHAAVITLLNSKPLVWLGRVSYSTYMVHAALVWTIVQMLTLILKLPRVPVADSSFVATPPLLGTVILLAYVALVLLLSHFTFKWIEDPFRNMAKRSVRR